MKEFALRVTLISLLLIGSPTTALLAQDGRQHVVSSEVLGEERSFTVYLPSSYDEQGGYAYPVLYLLDGQTNAGYALAVSQFLAESGVVPELITVAMPAGPTRGRDYLPPNPGGDANSSGDADRFLDHLESEIIPLVESNYRAAPLRLVSGHSVGGVFVTHAMITRPGLFRVYLAQSPYLIEAIAAPLLDRIATTLGDRTGDGFFYLNLGDEPNLLENYDRLREILANGAPEGFEWASDREDGVGHMGTRLVGHYAGLKGFFADRWKLPAESLEQGGGEALAAYVERLNADFGYPVLLGETSLQQATQLFFSMQDIAAAGSASELYAGYYPRSPVAHFLRANALVAGGAREEALEAVETAISLYEAKPDESLAALYQGMMQLRAGLNGGER